MRFPAPSIRAVFFDAVGTLLFPARPVAEDYTRIGARYRSSLTAESVAARFREAFRRQELLDESLDWRTDERRERERWQAIVAEVLPDATPAAGCLEELVGHYARPASWEVHPEAGHVLAGLARRGYSLGMCSNFDARLRAIVAGFPALAPLRTLTISSEVGWRKPAPAFFEHLVRQAGVPPDQVLVVGDDPVNDLAGARAAGLRAVLLDPRAAPDAPDRIASLGVLLAALPARLVLGGSTG